MKKENLKKRIFDSAWQIVEKEGMAQLNVRKIAELTECSLGSLYNSFENFQMLQLHINAAILSELFLLLEKVIQKGFKEEKSLRYILKELGLAYLAFGEKKPMLWKAVFEHFPLAHLPSWYTKHAQEGIYGICESLADFFELPREEVWHMVGFYWTSVHGLSAILLNRKMEMVSKLFKENYLDSYIEYCLNGLFSFQAVEQE